MKNKEGKSFGNEEIKKWEYSKAKKVGPREALPWPPEQQRKDELRAERPQKDGHTLPPALSLHIRPARSALRPSGLVSPCFYHVSHPKKPGTLRGTQSPVFQENPPTSNYSFSIWYPLPSLALFFFHGIHHHLI